MPRLSADEVGLHSVRPKPGATKDRKRIGRGEGSGMGKTSGRGHKGAGARSGSKRKVANEGGQNPIHMRMRKLRGLKIREVLGIYEDQKDEEPAEEQSNQPKAVDAVAEAE